MTQFPSPLPTAGNGARRLMAMLWAVLAANLVAPLAAAATLEAAPTTLDSVTFVGRDDHGTAAKLSDWRGKTVLLTMAYSSCREVCSFTLHRLEELQRSADRAGIAIEVVVISYDPKTDSPTSWSDYRQHHGLAHTNWHFLTGSSADTEKFAHALHFRYWRYDEHIVHDFKVLLIEPDERIATTLTWATRNDDPFTKAAVRCVATDSLGCKP